ncbi:MAG: class I SAM-dependent methyltransferase [Elusimicrobia bacterium]|nr:class I SAM-dependent methyltransferase [Elusimicrobiota bacterium]
MGYPQVNEKLAYSQGLNEDGPNVLWIWLEDGMINALRYRAFYGSISKFCSAPDTVLDFGCGHGELVSYLRGKGFNAYGVDPLLGSSADRCYASLADFIKEHDGPLKAVILNFSLEHLQDPAAVLEQLRALLADHGHLFIRVPDLDYIERRKRLASFQLRPGEHRFMAGKACLRSLLEKTGFEIVSMEPDASPAALITYPCSLFPRLDPFPGTGEAAKTGGLCLLAMLSLLFLPFFIFEYASGRSPIVRIVARRRES